jgi:carboxymethylenebutenolidase
MTRQGTRAVATLMHMISRRNLLGGGAALLAASRASATELAEKLDVPASEGPVALTRYTANEAGKRPAVIVLHGSRGFELRLLAYQRYADALTAVGIDVFLARYYGPADAEALQKLGTSEKREAYEDGRYGVWADRVSSTVTAILARPESSGRLGLLGFSLGGFVAAATAARDERIAALAVLYGGMPEKIASHVKRMPPLLELHGDADRNVPLANGVALIKLAKSVGAEADQITYPGKPHGFDFSDRDSATGDAIAHVVGFFKTRLVAA